MKIDNYIRSRTVNDWEPFQDPTKDEIEFILKKGCSYFEDITAGRTVEDGDRLIQDVSIEIVSGPLFDVEIPNSDPDEKYFCILYKQSYGEQRSKGGRLVWSPNIEVNEKIPITEIGGVEVPAWTCNWVPLSFTVNFLTRLFNEGYEGEDLLWASKEECETLNFDSAKN